MLSLPLHTVAVWTRIYFFLLMTLPQGSQDCQKMCQHPLNSNLEVWCTKIEKLMLFYFFDQKWKNNNAFSSLLYTMAV
jgi:hypothetical protein